MKSRRLSLVALVLAVLIVGAACEPSPGQAIEPNQHFSGVVNGKSGTGQIRVACPGPVFGRTTHPLSGQTLAVTQVYEGQGFTGAGASHIWATSNATTVAGVVPFTMYDTTVALPTTWTVPCEGNGQVVFSTCFDVLPCSPTAKPDVVTVEFVNIAV